MKRMKKIVSMLLAVIMVLGMSMTIFAADNHEHVITVIGNSDDEGTHTYEAYQIFAGDLADNPEYKKLKCENEDPTHSHEDGCYTIDPSKQQYILSNIEWGSGVDGAGLLTALHTSGVNDTEAVTAFKSKYAGELIVCKTAADVANFISKFASSTANKSEDIDVFASIVSEHLTNDCYINGNGTDEDPAKIHVNGSGYYFIKDMNASLADQEDAAYTRFLLQVVGNATVVVKSEVPSGDKKVYIDETTKDDANNASIGSHVSYEITSKVPNYEGYNYYYFIMNDTLSEGLTFDGVESITVKVGDKTLTRDEDYYIYAHHHTEDCYEGEGDNKTLKCSEKGVEPYTFRLAFADIMKYEVGADIVVTYSATVNDKAIVGTTGNPNTWNLQYSNNPDDTFDGERPDGENTPGLPAEDADEVLGQTPDEKTLTYVTELDITKYANSDAEDHLLAGAEFTLTGTCKQVVLSKVEYYRLPTDKDNNKEARYYLLLDGTYTTKAPTDTRWVETGVGTAETEKGYIKDADGNYIVPTNKEDYVGKTLYKQVKGTNSLYADPNTTYVRVVEDEINYVDMPISIEMTTGADGKISFKHLGAGIYTLTETVTPDGFNTIEPIEFEIVFTAPDRGVVTGDETCMWDLISDDFEVTEGGNDNSLGGVFSANIINKSGSLLPSTGGIGTTIFYVVGGILVIGAGILLVAKKRMSVGK